MQSAKAPRILIADDDLTVQAHARAVFAEAGMEVIEAVSMRAAREVLARQDLAAAIVDIWLGADDGLALVREVRGMHPHLPVVVLSRVKEFTLKIEALRAGADAYFEKPVDWLAFSRSVRGLLDMGSRSARVLVVDDDALSVQVLRRTLESGGYEVRVCTHAEQFDEALRGAQPDLILMDIDLPAISGFELARYIRQDERFETVPLVYVTSSASDERMLAAAAADGEQILRKPVPADVLLSTVAGRLEHFRRLRRLLDRDPLSGVLMRRAFLDRVAEAVAAFDRSRSRRFTLALLDLDHFKSVNDRFGHAAGDRVLISLGETIRRGIRLTDAAGRYGGEEFGILLHDTDAAGAVLLVERLLEEFGTIRHSASPDSSFAVTFSAGLAELTEGENAPGWLGRADRALYGAKAAGRNRVHVSSESAPGPPADALDPDTIASLRELAVLSGHDLIEELVGLFVGIAPERLETMRAAISRREGETLRRAAHALRSAAGNVGAVAIHHYCGELETAGAASAWNDAAPAFSRLEAAYPITREALTRLAGR